VQRESGSITILPERESFSFDPAARPSQVLLPAVRDVVQPLAGPGCRVDSTLRIQEFVGETVMEGVFYYEEDVGIVLKARERPSRPDERPPLPEPTISLKAESLLRKYQWPALIATAVLAALFWFGWQAGWFALRGGGGGPEVDAGPLERVVVFERVRPRRKSLVLEVRPGPEFERFGEVAEGCSLRPGVFRLLLEREGEPLGAILPLDLSDLTGKVEGLGAEQVVRLEVPYGGPAFDRVVVCR
jgi:hypothetical protein